MTNEYEIFLDSIEPIYPKLIVSYDNFFVVYYTVDKNLFQIFKRKSPNQDAEVAMINRGLRFRQN